MKKMIITFTIILVMSIAGAYFLYHTFSSDPAPKSAPAQEEYDEAMSSFISTFYTHARENIPNVTAEIEALSAAEPEKTYAHKNPPYARLATEITITKINLSGGAETEVFSAEPRKNKDILADMKDTFNIYQAVAAIANRDIEALKAIDPERLSFDGEITVDGDRFDSDVIDKLTGDKAKEGLFGSAMLSADNALGFALFNSMRDKTHEDKQKTLQMLEVLLDKKLDPNTKMATVFWIKDSPGDTHALDYVAIFPLSEFASNSSHPEAIKLLKEYGMQEVEADEISPH